LEREKRKKGGGGKRKGCRKGGEKKKRRGTKSRWLFSKKKGKNWGKRHRGEKRGGKKIKNCHLPCFLQNPEHREGKGNEKRGEGGKRKKKATI